MTVTADAGSQKLSDLTTMGVGGEADRMLSATTPEQLIDFAKELASDSAPWCVLAGGSNSIFSDAGFAGTVLLIRTSGIEMLPGLDADTAPGDGSVLLRVEAGNSWDDLVEYAVENDLSGIEALSGIPGSVGAAPVQNIGAYGQELSAVLHSVEFFDTERGELITLDASQLELGYRSSIFKTGRQGVIISVVLNLTRAAFGEGEALSEPVRYAQLAQALSVELEERVSLRSVRQRVLELRAAKGMVYSSDPDSHGVGSFFMNPIVTEKFAKSLPESAPRWPVDAPDEHPLVKLSAAWLIEYAGIRKGFTLPGSGAAISSKHSLAITNRGQATAEDVAELARYVSTRVLADTGVIIQPEPNIFGLEI